MVLAGDPRLGAAEAPMTPRIVTDVHSGLNATSVDEVVRVDSLEAIQSALGRAGDAKTPVAIAGGRHAMGGQQFCTGGVLLDTRALARVLSLDPERAVVEVEAGIQWPALAQALGRSPLTFAQKQTGANDLSIGGAVSANVHGRGLALRPFVADVESLVVVGPDGRAVRCSRDEEPDLFALVVGGYGLFGVIYSVELRLVPRRTLERVVELSTVDELMAGFRGRIDDGFVYGDFQFAIDPSAGDFLRRGVFSCYRPVPDCEIPSGQRVLDADDWRGLLGLAHTDKARAFDLYARHYLATSGQLYRSDSHQLALYDGGYHADVGPGSEMITELYVPRPLLADFMAAAARDLRSLEADVIYGTVRLIERDGESFLEWAREPWACVVVNLHVEHTRLGLERARTAFLRLIDLALDRGGSFYLTYHRWATRRQLEVAYPRLGRFLEAKLEREPGELFQSDWYRSIRSTFAREEAA
jgi:FAD/FMN-containing dehydrogenase